MKSKKLNYPKPRQVLRRLLPSDPVTVSIIKWMLMSSVFFTLVTTGLLWIFPEHPFDAIVILVIISGLFGFALLLICPDDWRYSKRNLVHISYLALGGILGVLLGLLSSGGVIQAGWLLAPLFSCFPAITGFMLKEYEALPPKAIPITTLQPRKLAREIALLESSSHYVSIRLTNKNGQNWRLGYSVNPKLVFATSLATSLSVLLFYHAHHGKEVPSNITKVALAFQPWWSINRRHLSGNSTFDEARLKFTPQLILKGGLRIIYVCQIHATIIEA